MYEVYIIYTKMIRTKPWIDLNPDFFYNDIVVQVFLFDSINSKTHALKELTTKKWK